MSAQRVVLKKVTREDVGRIKNWLNDKDVSENWFGRYSYGEPAHLGYHPDQMEHAPDTKWDAIFNNPEHRFLSIYTTDLEHIGEIHVAIEEPLGDGQISILIGRKDLWHQGFGTVAMEDALKIAFNEWGLYRVWIDVPEYNTAALGMFERLGFTHEGTLRKSRPHEGARFDSVVMGMLLDEYLSKNKA